MEAIAVKAGEAALSTAFEAILNKLSSLDILKYARSKNVESEFNRWNELLEKLKIVLDDAEERQMSEGRIKSWLDDLRNLVYDAEDILDEFSTEVQRQNFNAESESSATKVRKLFNNCTPHGMMLNVSGIMFNVSMGSKMKAITERFEEITKVKENLRLIESATGGSNRVVRERLETTCLVQESQVYGREKDKETLINELLSSDSNGKPVSVVAIVGMGGLGKTTLAQLVYNDQTVRKSFDIKAWVCVSNEFDVLKITLKIIEGFTSSPCNSKDLNTVQEKLKKELHGKKFFLVLDDMWNENYLQWDALSQPLAVGGLGSKVLITTRIENVASTAGAMFMHRLKKLEFEECLSLLALHAFGVNAFSGHPLLREIGEQIAKKCDGLPLAAKALGGLLRGNFNPREWSKVLNSNMWELPQDKCPILPALRVSYHYLPSHLKRCFAFCAIFPKDYEFKKDDLILWWMGEGFLEHSKSVLSNFTQVGNEYFEDLLSRSFFQPSFWDEDSIFVMHDLMNDLAMWISGGICLHLHEDNEGSNDIKFENLRHLSFMNHYYEVAKRFEKFSSSMRLRSFIALRKFHLWFPYYSFSNAILDELIAKMRFLKVLCLSGYRITKLPHSIFELKLLCHLDMSFTKIHLLPESISELLNLQILKLNNCHNLIQLPREIRKLVNLRPLDISETNKLKVMPSGIGCLTNLQLLSKFIVGEKDGLSLNELKGLSLIRGEFSIWGLQKVSNIQDARGANLKANEGLVSLEFKWMEETSALEMEKHTQILDELQPHASLKSLEIFKYNGKHFPKWVGDRSFTNLETLYLIDCKSVSLLPPLGGLMSLKMLQITDMHEVKSLGKEFLGNTTKFEKTFPSLETLILKRMNALEEWCLFLGYEEEAKVEFHHLRKLVVSGCPLLAGRLPNQLPLLGELSIIKCPNLTNLECRHPSLRELVVKDCSVAALKTLGNLSSLVRLKLENIREMICMDDELFSMLGELQKLEIVRCKEVKTLARNGKAIEGMACLESLVIEHCEELEELVVTGETGLNYLPSLELLEIRGCDKLVSFGAMRLSSSLKKMDIGNCKALKCLPEGFMMDGSSNCESALEDLSINSCPSLTTFPGGRFPDLLVALKICGCKNLESMPEFSNSIKRLTITQCEHLQSLPKLPISIECVDIKDLKNLAVESTTIEKSMSISLDSENVQYQLQSQECIEIGNVEELESELEKTFADCSLSLEDLILSSLNLKRLPEHITSFKMMKRFEISYCKNLRKLPIQELTSLRELKIMSCPNLELFACQHLPRELKRLQILNCEKVIEGLFNGGLSLLTSLTHLHINGGSCRENIKPPEAPVCLPKLQTLGISDFGNLESLESAFQLSSSVEVLDINKFPKLREFPIHDLASNLGSLRISNCPLLKKRCMDRKGEYWRLLYIIPQVWIDNEVMDFT